MLYFPQTRPEFSVERPVAAGVTIPAEGCALVANLTGGVYGVKPSTGAAGEVFVGVALSQPTTIASAAKMEDLTVAGGKVLLGKTPIGGSISVVNLTTNVQYTSGTPAATVYQQDGTIAQQLNFDGPTNNGVKVRVAYRYAPTLAEAMALQGNVLPGGPAGAYLGQTGVIQRGDVYTDQIDTTGNWATAVGVSIGANGLFVPQALAANCMRGVTIIELPSAARSFVGLNINASV